MSLNINRVTIAGHLTRDPETKMLANDNCVSSFAIACNRRFKGKDGETKEEVTFVDVEAWGKTGELVGRYLTKGAPVYLDGRLKLEGWETKTGEKRQRIKVVAENVQFLGKTPARSATDHVVEKSYDSAAKQANDPMDLEAGNLPPKTQPASIEDEPTPF